MVAIVIVQVVERLKSEILTGLNSTFTEADWPKGTKRGEWNSLFIICYLLNIDRLTYLKIIMTALIILINVLLFYVYFQAGLLTLMDTYLPAGVKQSDKKN